MGWDSFKWRNHDPAIGRFFNVDPIAEKYYYNSPYAFSENKVIAHVELEGLEANSIKDIPDKATSKEEWKSVGRGFGQLGKRFGKELSRIGDNIKEVGRGIKEGLKKAGSKGDQWVADTFQDSEPKPVDEKQRTAPTPNGGNRGPEYNPDGTAEGKGGENIMMSENGQKNIENPDSTPSNVVRDTIPGTAVGPQGEIHNTYTVVQNEKDTIDQRSYVPDDLMPKK